MALASAHFAGFIPVRDVYPVGRLDFDSEGLLLLTDHELLQHRLADPRFGHPRTYWAQVEGQIDQDSVDRLKRGLQIQNYRTSSCLASLMSEPLVVHPTEPPVRYRKAIPTSWLELVLTEGRNRQVRRMTAAVGYPTLRLVRAAIGTLTLDGLRPSDGAN